MYNYLLSKKGGVLLRGFRVISPSWNEQPFPQSFQYFLNVFGFGD